jgi:hypothetical protein
VRLRKIVRATFGPALGSSVVRLRKIVRATDFKRD